MDMIRPFDVPGGRVARGSVTAPPSKSHAIRALVCAHLSEGRSSVGNVPDAADVTATRRAIAALEVGETTLDLAGSGTAFRFLAAVAATNRRKPVTLTGDASLRARPMNATVHSLRALGATVDATKGATGLVAPITVGDMPHPERHVVVDASSSSHPLSALLLIGSVLPDELLITPIGPVASQPYVDLTIWTLAQFNVAVRREGNAFRTFPLSSWGAHATVVGDWSSAAFPMAAASTSGGDVEITGVEFDSPQADRRIVDLLRDFGATIDRTPTGVRVRGNDRRPLDVDLRDAPDLAPLVGALGCVASGTTRVRGAAHLRLKESDRIATVVAAARALGCDARETPDGFEIEGPARHGGTIETKHDHRIAMAFAVAGLAVPGVVIDDPACVAKSYPGFWEDLARLIG